MKFNAKDDKRLWYLQQKDKHALIYSSEYFAVSSKNMSRIMTMEMKFLRELKVTKRDRVNKKQRHYNKNNSSNEARKYTIYIQ